MLPDDIEVPHRNGHVFVHVDQIATLVSILPTEQIHEEIDQCRMQSWYVADVF
jgi:hypothetical protein